MLRIAAQGLLPHEQSTLDPDSQSFTPEFVAVLIEIEQRGGFLDIQHHCSIINLVDIRSTFSDPMTHKEILQGHIQTFVCKHGHTPSAFRPHKPSQYRKTNSAPDKTLGGTHHR